MLTRVAYIAPPGHGLHKVRSLLGDPERFELHEFLSMDEVQTGLGACHFDLLIIRVPVALDSTVALIQKIQSRFPMIPVITIAPAVSPGVRYQSRHLERHRFVEDLEIGDLAKVVSALRAPAHGARARMHPRASRKGHVELVNSETGERIQAEFVDFAQMGARITLQTRRRLGCRSHWQVHYLSTSEPGKTQRLESMVVWESNEKVEGLLESLVTWPRTVIGVRFIASL